MDDFAELSIDGYLDQVGDRTPTPGGGGVTGLAGALACALARMVVAFSVRKKTEPPARDQMEATARRFHRMDQLLRALITQDATAYAAMTEAAASRRLQPSGTSPAHAAYNDAVLAAATVPMEMAAIASNALSTMDEFKAVASRYMLSDLAIAAVLADATARAARYTVRINARELGDVTKRAELMEKIDEIAEHCEHHRQSVEAFVHNHLESGPAQSR